MRADSEGCDTR